MNRPTGERNDGAVMSKRPASDVIDLTATTKIARKSITVQQLLAVDPMWLVETVSTQEDKLKQLKTFAAHLLQHIEVNKIKQNQIKCAYCQTTEASMTNCKCGYSIFCDACKGDVQTCMCCGELLCDQCNLDSCENCGPMCCKNPITHTKYGPVTTVCEGCGENHCT